MRLSRGRTVAGALLALFVLVAAIPMVRWRVAIVVLKVVGQLDGVDWQDIPFVLRRNSGIRLSRLVRYRNPYTVIANPLDTPADRNYGGELFARTCARCHGDVAQGGAGPALVGRSLTHGTSDWAMYRTIRGGVPGTAMQAWGLQSDNIWRVIAFLRQRSFEFNQRLAAGTDGGTAQVAPPTPATSAMLLRAGEDTADWLLPDGSYSGQRFSRDTQLNSGNVAHLAVRWIHQFNTTDAVIETTPIVVGRRLYVTLPNGSVLALDTATGQQVWEYARPVPGDIHLCCITTNRGVAVLGTRVYVGTLDAHLIALDAASGQMLWDQNVADYHQGYSITSAPLPIGDMIVTGIAGGDFPTRGFISAYDAATGALRWRTYTIPAAGEAGHDTWPGDSWRAGGATTWGIGVYDPALGLLYWGTGNPAPDYNAANRQGDNLYSNSLLALQVGSGALAWHFQYSPGDDHDWDSVQTPALIDAMEGGVAKKELSVANRNGFFYVLDRETGKFVRGAAYAKQTWAGGLTADGRPARLAGSRPTPGGTYLYPSTTGAANWWPQAYSPLTGLHYVDVLERGGIYFSSESPPGVEPGRLYVGSAGRYIDSDFQYAAVRAIDPATATVRWEYRNAASSDLPRGGLLATAGNLLFGSDTSKLIALDATSGAPLWSFDTGAQISAPPVSYRVGERQYITVAAGQLLISFALPERAPEASPVATPSRK
jgi:alcohol dehydrogenase (cytochrome c)